MPIARQVLVAGLLLLVGLVLLAVPARAEGPVLVPISEGHGLSVLDSFGAALLAVAVTWLEVLVAVRLPRLGLSPRALFGLGLLAGLGIGLVVASSFSGFFWWWAVGAACAGAAALVLVPLTARR
ncbi:hypothetical protein [Luedemannella helvata]|uniref:Major facilitator superfamily (MFS) profile domain-containing protein n=1 Tax=Luedemannella helvata TaxID=349315 RepID=A0ABN2JR31_9ACTN